MAPPSWNDDEWDDMPVVRSASNSLDLDDEDQSKYHYRAPSPPRRGTGHKRAQSGATTNATGRHLDVDDARGYDWRSKPAGAGSGLGDAGAEDDDDGDGTGYTQLRLDEDEDEEEIHAATEYLFADAYTGANGAPPGMNDDRPGATPLSQLATTKQLLTEGQKIAYVGLCSLAAKEMVRTLARVPGKETDEAAQSMEGWKLRIMARLYQHMDIEASEQSMIDSLAAHGVLSSDLAPALITTQTVPNPDYDPEAAREREEEQREEREKEEEKKREEREEQERERQRVEKEQQEALKHDRKEQEETPATAAEVEQAPPVAEKAEGKEADIGESEDDGDIGMSGEVPPPVYSAKAVERNLATTSKSAGDSSEADGDAGDGDLGAGAGTPTGAAPSTPKLSSVEMEAQPTPKRASVPLADPNTAAQAAADPARDPQNTLGLTSTPQAVEPPPSALEGVTTQISSADESITLDIRWTVLCDLFLVLTADSVYDARSRVLLERVAETLGLSWMDVTKFEKRVTDALEIEEGVESLKDASVMDRRAALAKRKRLVMMGLATVGGGLVIGLSAGLLAPVIGAGLGAMLGTIGIGGTTGFLGGVGGAAIITTTGTVAGSGLANRAMSRRTRSVRTFELKPLHNNKRVNCIVTMSGFMSGQHDDVRLPFSVIDSIMGDVFSVHWEPDMMREMGGAIGILWNETLGQGVQHVLAATIAGSLVGALTWPLVLTKLGYLIDNPWSNALDRSKAAGLILADVLARRQLGVRPITLIGFSLGARSIFYALIELARIKAFGVVQNVYLMGTPVTASDKVWKEARSVVAGRFVNAFSRTDWILGYLFRATSGGFRSVAGLHPVERVHDVENVDVTHVVPGHLAYRSLMPLVLDELGFRCTADYFDEPEDLSKIPEREVVRTDPDYELKTVKTKSGGFGKIWKKKGSEGSESETPRSATSSSTPSTTPGTPTSRPQTANAQALDSTPTWGSKQAAVQDEDDEDDLPPRMELPARTPAVSAAAAAAAAAAPPSTATPESERPPSYSVHFDTSQMLAELRESGVEVKELESSLPPLVASSSTAEPPVTPVKSRPTSLGKQASSSSLTTPSPSPYSSHGMNAPASSSRDRTLGKGLPSLDIAPPSASFSRDATPSPSLSASLSRDNFFAPAATSASASASVSASASGNPFGAPSRARSRSDLATANSSASSSQLSSRRPSPCPSVSISASPSPYARSFSASDPRNAPPPSPPRPFVDPSAGVSLSFASYDDDEIDVVPPSHASASASNAYTSYGLSSASANQLAQKFGEATTLNPSASASASKASLSSFAPPPSDTDALWRSLGSGSASTSSGVSHSRGVSDHAKPRGGAGAGGVFDDFPSASPLSPPPALSFGGLDGSITGPGSSAEWSGDNPWGSGGP